MAPSSSSSYWQRELDDPSTPPVRLMAIAQEAPESHAAVLAHPNIYPGLRQWIEAQETSARGRGRPGKPVRHAPRVPQPRRKRLINGVAIAASVVVLAGGGFLTWALLKPVVSPSVVVDASGSPSTSSTPDAARSSTATPTRTPAPTPTPTLPASLQTSSAYFRDGGFYESSIPFLLAEGSGDFDPERIGLEGDYFQFEASVAVDSIDAPRVAALIDVEHAADGLQAAKTELHFVVLDETLTGVTVDVIIAQNPGTSLDGINAELRGTSGPVAVVATEDSSGEVRTRTAKGYNTETGAELWSVSGEAKVSASDVVVVADVGEEPKRCQQVSGIKASTGEVLWSVDETVQASLGGKSCSSISVETGWASTRYVPIHLGYGPGTVLFDLQSGASLAPPDGRQFHSQWLEDPATGDIYFPTDGEGSKATVYEPATGATRFSLPYAEVRALEFEAEALFDGKLYGSNSEGKIIVDVATASSQVSAWDAHGVAVLGPWVLYSDGLLRSDVPLSG